MKQKSLKVSAHLIEIDIFVNIFLANKVSQYIEFVPQFLKKKNLTYLWMVAYTTLYHLIPIHVKFYVTE